MLGVVRRCPSLDSLEFERSDAPKIPKSDALSIYEATLQKLKLGSHRAFAPDAVAASPAVAQHNEIKLRERAAEDGPSSSNNFPSERYSAMEEDLSS